MAFSLSQEGGGQSSPRSLGWDMTLLSLPGRHEGYSNNRPELQVKQKVWSGYLVQWGKRVRSEGNRGEDVIVAKPMASGAGL